MELKFTVRQGKKDPDLAEVRYDCACGCHPTARYTRGAAQAGSQHCCCGTAHFAGPDADAQLRKYLEKRRAEGLDELVKGHEFGHATVKAPWGGQIEVAYSIPRSE